MAAQLSAAEACSAAYRHDGVDAAKREKKLNNTFTPLRLADRYMWIGFSGRATINVGFHDFVSNVLLLH